MEPQLTIENIPFIWGVAFCIDIIIGLVGFALVIRRNVTPWLRGTVMWVGWWSFASALSLIISMVNGPMSPFSYHQVGVFTETMTNIGLVFWCMVYAFHNWYITPKDWQQIEIMRSNMVHANRQKELENDSE